MAFTRDAILKFIELPATDLKIIESIDMNRFIQNKVQIQMLIDILFPLYRHWFSGC